MKFSESFQIWLAGLITGICMMGIVGLVFWPNVPKESPAIVHAEPAPFPNLSITQVFVGSNRWAIFVGYNDRSLEQDDALGQTLCDQRAIIIHSGQAYVMQKEIILHELLHANTCTTALKVNNEFYNSSNKKGSHPGLDRISVFMTTLAHDNPELGRYLFGQ